MNGHTFLVKVNALECEPDSDAIRYSLITLENDYAGLTRMTDPVNASEMKAALREMGMPEGAISSRMAKAPFLY